MRPQDRGQSAFQRAITEFEAARVEAGVQEVLARFTGRPVSLLSYDEVAGRLRMVGQAARGYRTIPTRAIVGSVGRYNDFTREFLPRMAQDAQRWAHVKSAAASVSELPPIEVYQVGEGYFVRDGNHRVSIALRQGIDYLEAHVIEVRTRVPFAVDDSPDLLIAKAEYADFLDYTKLDNLRPGVDLLVSLPGQYERLENLLEVFRYFVEEAEERELPWTEAVARWYDEAYLPVVEAIREQDLLQRFPGRTETDLFVWLAVHRAALEHALDWQIAPEAAVVALAPEAGSLLPGGRRRLLARVRRALSVRLRRQPAGRPLSWIDGKKLARYSDRLFGELLLLLEPDEAGREALSSALAVAEREQAFLHVLQPGSAAKAAAGLWAEMEIEASRLDVRASLTTVDGIAGKASDHLAERALFVDLVVVSRSVAGEGKAAVEDDFLSLLQAERPVWVGGVNGLPGQLFLDSTGKADDKAAVFVATYLAERWRLPLTVLTAGVDKARQERICAYLAVHEVEAQFSDEGGLREAGTESLIVLGTWERRWLGRRRVNARVIERLSSTPGALLLCP